jgi:hypothetical protein
VLPHFDKFPKWIPDVVSRIMRELPEGVSVVGIDEETAIIGGPTEWQVVGRQSAWTLEGGERAEHASGSFFSTNH